MVKRIRITEEQKALFFPYLDCLVSQGFHVLEDGVIEQLMRHFNTGPFTATVIQREYIADQRKLNSKIKT